VKVEYKYNNGKAPKFDQVKYSDTFTRLIRTNNYDTNSLSMYLPLVLLRKKNGLICTNLSTSSDISKNLDDLNIPYIVQRQEEVNRYFISYNSSYLKDINISYNQKQIAFTTDNYIGKFLGVPDKDNMWFDEACNISEYTPLPEYLDKKFDDIFYARLVSWICKPTEEGLNRTIKIGKEWYDVLRDVGEKYNYYGSLRSANYAMHLKNSSWY
jgi:hypothetical protein